MDKSCDHNKKNSQKTLVDLPEEIFLMICSFLNVSTLNDLSLVCKHFYQILSSTNILWKRKIKHIWPDAEYPILDPSRSNERFWKLSCVALEKQKALLIQNECPLIEIAKHEYSDTGRPLRLMHDGTAYITGKGRSLIYRKFNSNNDIYSIYPAHSNEITDITVINNTIVTCSDQNNIKSWILGQNSLIRQNTYECNRRNREYNFLSSWPQERIFVASSFTNMVTIFDMRLRRPIGQYQSCPCPCKIVMNSQYILSGCSTSLSVWDLRAARIKHITIPDTVSCMKMHLDCVCVVDWVDDLHVLKIQNDFEKKSYDIKHDDFISGVYLTYIKIITCSIDGKIKIWSATKPPCLLYTLISPIERIWQMDCQNGVLAISDDKDIVIYRFKH